MADYPEKSHPLKRVCEHKGTVGVIPYYVQEIIPFNHKKKVYILLGRENINGRREESREKYCDFGGSIEQDGTTIVANLVRELKEETINQLLLQESDILGKGILLYKINQNKREVFDVLYPLNEEEYEKVKDLNSIKDTLDNKKLSAAYFEKDEFLWVDLEELYKEISNSDYKDEFPIETIEGNRRKIKIRKFFYDDFLKHPAFDTLVLKLLGA